jgi:3-hydroxyacyl-CoA dehydrogenase
MNYEERLRNVSVLGAAGKMGSGILLLTAVELADLCLKPENKGKPFVLNAIDVSDEALAGVMKYLRAQVLKIAEKKIVVLRSVYMDRKDLVENYEVIDQYVFDVLANVRTSTRMENAYESTLIFEAIKEDPGLKSGILSGIRKNNPNDPWFFTNTSSIPISELDQQAGLNGRIIGFHFYNPPAVQKLVEVIKAVNTTAELEEFALAFAKSLRKVVVPSHDIAGFIGNGHFMRDILYAEKQVEALQKEFSFVESVYAINKISQEYLIRPMGIFQLIDYVGIDVCSYILSVMDNHLPSEELKSPLLVRFLESGVRGGQFSDGSQKDGFLKYEKGKITAVFDPEKKTYIPIAEIQPKVEQILGPVPEPLPWKAVISNPVKDDILKTYFTELKKSESRGAELACAFGLNSKNTGLHLVNTNVAFHEKDVNTVLLTGFFHAYGPVNDYFV